MIKELIQEMPLKSFWSKCIGGWSYKTLLWSLEFLSWILCACSLEQTQHAFPEFSTGLGSDRHQNQ